MDVSGQDQGPSPAAPRRFQTTRWSLVLAARDGNSAEAREALAALCEAYWYPLYAFVRRKGHDPESAGDLVQAFFTRLLEKHDLVAVDRRKGKFRSYLMAACTHFLANQRDHERAEKRGGGRAVLSIDGAAAEGRYRQEPAHQLTAERLFEQRWVLALLELVVNRLESEMAEAGKTQQFETLRPALLGEAERLPYAEAAVALGCSEEAARASAQRLRRRYRELVREEIARTLEEPSDAQIDEEIQALFAALSG